MRTPTRSITDAPAHEPETLRISLVPGIVLQAVLVLAGLGSLAGAIQAGRSHEVVWAATAQPPTIRTYETLTLVLGGLTALCFVLAAWIQVRRRA